MGTKWSRAVSLLFGDEMAYVVLCMFREKKYVGFILFVCFKFELG